MTQTGTRQEPTEHWFIRKWSESAATTLEELLEQELTAEWHEIENPAAHTELEARWWRCTLGVRGTEASIWAGVPNATGAQLASLGFQLDGAVADTASDDVFLPGTIDKVTRGLAAALEQYLQTDIEVSGPESSDHGPDVGKAYVASLSRGEEHILDMVVAMDPPIDDLLASASRTATAPDHQPASFSCSAEPGLESSSLDLIAAIEVPVHVVFGTAELPLKEVARLAPGSVVELSGSCQEPVDVVVNDQVVARGRMVVIDGNYGVTIEEVVRPNRG